MTRAKRKMPWIIISACNFYLTVRQVRECGASALCKRICVGATQQIVSLVAFTPKNIHFDKKPMLDTWVADCTSFAHGNQSNEGTTCNHNNNEIGVHRHGKCSGVRGTPTHSASITKTKSWSCVELATDDGMQHSVERFSKLVLLRSTCVFVCSRVSTGDTYT